MSRAPAPPRERRSGRAARHGWGAGAGPGGAGGGGRGGGGGGAGRAARHAWRAREQRSRAAPARRTDGSKLALQPRSCCAGTTSSPAASRRLAALDDLERRAVAVDLLQRHLERAEGLRVAHLEVVLGAVGPQARGVAVEVAQVEL